MNAPLPALLVNENFPAPSTHLLRAAGLDVLSISETRAGISDIDVLALARDQGRWLITFDTDYAELIYRRRLPPPPVVLLLREPHYRPADPASWLMPLMAHPQELSGQFCVLTRETLRKRPLLTSVPSSGGTPG